MDSADGCELCGATSRSALPCATCGVDSTLCDACLGARLAPPAQLAPFVCQFCVKVQHRADELSDAYAEDDQREEPLTEGDDA